MTSRVAAMRYARALFDVALKETDPLRIESELSAFASGVAGHEALSRVLVHPAIPVARKRAIVETLIKKTGPMAPVLEKTLLLLADGDRLALLPELAEAYRERVLEHQKIVRAEVTTAIPLSEDRRKAIADGLAAATGRKVTVSTRVDPSLIGGAVARIGSTVYDGSVARQLERLRERLIETQ
jgi:F-type H+-transporting ATPase subunit delta